MSGSAVIGAAAAPWIFEVPFDLIIMPRSHPVVDPGSYRLLLFGTLILTGITTLALLSLSPAMRMQRATLWCLAGMLALFAGWGLFGFSYPSAPGPVTLNALSKICECVVQRFRPGPLPGSVPVTGRDSSKIWPSERALLRTCPPGCRHRPGPPAGLIRGMSARA